MLEQSSRRRTSLPLPLAGAIAAAVLLTAPRPAAAEEADQPALLSFSLGAFDFRRDDATLTGRIEYRHDAEWFQLFHPIAGVSGMADGGGFVYGGVSFELPLWRRLAATVSVAPGAYIEGSGRDLGGVFSIRSALELNWRFENDSRLGLMFAHMSNAHMYDRNPGAETLSLSYSVPFPSLFQGL